MFFQNVSMALSSIWRNKGRSFLTMLGMIIGIGSVIAILSLGEGFKNALKTEVLQFGSNLVTVNPSTEELESEIAQDDQASIFGGGPPGGDTSIDQEDLDDIRNLPSVQAATAFNVDYGKLASTDSGRLGVYNVVITDSQMPETLQLETATGRFLDDTQRDLAIPQMVIGHNVRKTLEEQGVSDPLGKTITIKEQQYQVVGILGEYTSLIQDLFGVSFNDFLYITFDGYGKISDRAVSFQELDVLIKDGFDIEESKGQVLKAMQGNRDGIRDFRVTTQDEILKFVDTIFGFVTTFIAAIASISLLVGGIGIMNIMLVTVTERTREIGVRKAIGASNSHILSQFLVEAVIISVLGGILGIAFAMLMGFVVTLFTDDITPQITLNAILLAVGVSSLVGVIFGIFPAYRAARKDPIDALRYE